MEFYAELFEPILPHLKEHLFLYLVGIPVLMGGVVATHRYSVPIIVFLTQFIVYSVIMHAAVHLCVRIFAWFKNTSSMQMVRDPEGHVEWTTPLLRFWLTESYDPPWVVWIEVLFMGLILYLVHRLQPLKPQYKHRSRYQKTPAEQSVLKKDDDWGTPRKFTIPPSNKTRR